MAFMLADDSLEALREILHRTPNFLAPRDLGSSLDSEAISIRRREIRDEALVSTKLISVDETN